MENVLPSAWIGGLDYRCTRGSSSEGGNGDETGCEEWLAQVARASGIETSTRKDLAKLDRKRPKKGSNKDWIHPHDPEARITKMKDGRTHLAHKFEQAVDVETGAVVAVTYPSVYSPSHHPLGNPFFHGLLVHA